MSAFLFCKVPIGCEFVSGHDLVLCSLIPLCSSAFQIHLMLLLIQPTHVLETKYELYSVLWEYQWKLSEPNFVCERILNGV